jgi:hypothetical protein
MQLLRTLPARAPNMVRVYPFAHLCAENLFFGGSSESFIVTAGRLGLQCVRTQELQHGLAIYVVSYWAPLQARNCPSSINPTIALFEFFRTHRALQTEENTPLICAAGKWVHFHCWCALKLCARTLVCYGVQRERMAVPFVLSMPLFPLLPDPY